MLFMYKNYLANASDSDLYMGTLGKYFTFLKQKFTSSNGGSDDMLTVHELNEQQPSLRHHPLAQLLSTADPISIEAIPITDFPSTQQLTTPFDFLQHKKRRNQKSNSCHSRSR
ncbi:unnamed protein product [Adineta steineri]|uniref:Uncharacterized protein n=1 Tax=Adineta steineri TaxID=433720 RepID=A0A818IZK1_9BILA|nr:unnamed protein product [Adineta steineri]CAF0774924.1 unnamed protein product [Adineta steineri]CAF0793490.1 unnamed protein product [Adineta steineri]CAF3517506.1 unnamed protein product [Adineta steineri]CAF3531208.1 unnamed protein product [Adineta steineri]